MVSNPILITTRGKAKILGKDMEKDNIHVLKWYTMSDLDKVMIALPKTSFTNKLLLESQVFTINEMTGSFDEDIAYCEQYTGEYIDKFKNTSFNKNEGETIDCPHIQEADQIVECTMINTIDQDNYVTIIGQITHRGAPE